MKGSYFLRVRNKRIEYNMTLNRNITIIKGDSGTGKTALIFMLNAYLNLGKDSGVHIDTNIRVFKTLARSSDWRTILSNSQDTVYFVDEDVDYILTKSFYDLLCRTGSYLVYISRSGMTGYLQYAISSVFEFRAVKTDSYYTNIAYNLYNDKNTCFKPDIVLTEDSTSGLDTLKHGLKIPVYTSMGKDNVVGKLESVSGKCTNIYILVDGAAFGNQIEKLFTEIKSLPSCNILVFAPESFEYLVLNTSKFKKYCLDELSNTSNYVDPKIHKTWENYFEDLLVSLCSNYNHVKYEKKEWSKLNPFFKNPALVKEVVDQIVDIDSSLKI